MLARVLVFAVVLVITLVPIAWIVLTSFKPEGEWVSDPPVWIPSDWTVASYERMWDDGGGRVLLTSVVVVGDLDGPGHDHRLHRRLQLQPVPHRRPPHRDVDPVGQVPAARRFAVPLLIMFTRVDLYDRWLGLIILYTTFQLPFVVWMMKGFFDEVPRDIEESARVDGCGWLGTFWRFSLPLSARASWRRRC